MFAKVLSRAQTLARRSAPALVAALVFAAFSAAPALAQEGAAAPAAAAEDTSLSIGELIILSGFIGWVIIALSVVALAQVIEAYVTLSREKLAPPALIDEITSLFDEKQYQEALELCENEPTFFTRVVAAGITTLGHPYDVIMNSISEMGDEEAIRLHQKLGWISVQAATAPMLGLFGTVQGMIASFHVIANTANPTPAQLASGIYVALLTTFEGLMIAIPATAAFAYLRNRLVRNLIEVGAIVEDLFERFRTQS
jgi:biopolymer transport protein ExbB